ncbi:MAG: rhodanese-like domain-containing protein [Thermoplasmatota archaeon]
MIPSVDARQAARRLAAHDATLLDVREAFELELASVPGALHIPLGELADRLDELPRAKPLLVLCHHGARSASATRFLIANGRDATNVAGGIAAWAREVDASVGAY